MPNWARPNSQEMASELTKAVRLLRLPAPPVSGPGTGLVATAP